MNDNIIRLRTARNILHRLEDDGIINNNLSMEQITAIRLAEFAIDEICATDVQPPVKRGHWIEKSEEYYRLWQDSGRSWDDMPYFVTGLKFACSCCFNQYDVNAEGVEEWDFCPKCGADMRGKANG